MRSDGVLYEVLRFRESDKKISKFKTAFSSKNDIESLTLDIKNRHLITTPKAKDLQDNSFKGLYHIPIDSKQMEKSDDFPQPEGITFSPQGTLYISTEAKGGSAAIMEVVLD